MRKSKKDLQYFWIIGAIDAYGAIHSEGFDYNKDDVPMHGDLYPNIFHKRWRWALSGINKSGDWTDSDIEEFDRIVQHISKKYKIKLNQHGISEYYYY